MSVFMLSLLFGPFEAAGRLPQLKIKRWAVGSIKLSFRKLNSNLREQVGRAAAVLALLYAWLSLQVVRLRRRNRVSFGDSGHTDLRSGIRAHPHFAEYVPIIGLMAAVLEFTSVTGLAGWRPAQPGRARCGAANAFHDNEISA